MKRKQLLVGLAVFTVLALLVYLQVRSWKRFEWGHFAVALQGMRWERVLAAVALIYVADSLRAFRWAIFLRPVKEVPGVRLIAAQFIGFSGLALFGRPGEFIRPYIIAKKEQLTFSSQMAVWTVERIFDMSAVAVILASDLLFASNLRGLPYHHRIREMGLFMVLFVALGVIIAILIKTRAENIATACERRWGGSSPKMTAGFCSKLRSFAAGLDTIHDTRSLISASLISLAIWSLIACSYYMVVHAYAHHFGSLQRLSITECVLLMAGSIAGGVLQLPAVGGGSQLATIAILQNIFNVGGQGGENFPELATSCGILLWLVTFMSVAPAGLALARQEHISLRSIEKESEEEAVHVSAPSAD